MPLFMGCQLWGVIVVGESANPLNSKTKLKQIYPKTKYFSEITTPHGMFRGPESSPQEVAAALERGRLDAPDGWESTAKLAGW